MRGPLNVKKVYCPMLLSSFKHIYESLERFSHKYPISNFTETRPVGAEKCGQMDGCEALPSFATMRTRLKPRIK